MLENNDIMLYIQRVIKQLTTFYLMVTICFCFLIFLEYMAHYTRCSFLFFCNINFMCMHYAYGKVNGNTFFYTDVK